MTTEERVGKLEKDLARVRRFNHWLLAALCLCVGAWAFTAVLSLQRANTQEAGAAAKEFRAKAFIVEDDNGKTRATLMASKDESGLTLLDETGAIRAGLGVGKDGVGLRVTDEKGKDRIALGLGKQWPGLLLYDEKGKVIWKAP